MLAIYGPTFFANFQDFWKSFNGSDKTKHVKNVVKKCQKIIF